MEEIIIVKNEGTEDIEVDIRDRISMQVQRMLQQREDWLAQEFPNCDPDTIEVVSASEFFVFLKHFILDHLEDHVGPVYNKRSKTTEDRDRPGFFTIFGRKKVAFGSLKKTYLEIAEQAEGLGRSENTAVATWFTDIVKDIKRVAGNPESDDYYERLPGAIASAFDTLLVRLQMVGDFQLFETTRHLCNFDAIYDLITGNLHRLDPVIGDLGCQWRTPFVLDLHDAVKAQLEKLFDKAFINIAIAEYHAARSTLMDWPEILTAFDEAATAQEKVDTGRKSKKGKPVYTKATVLTDRQVMEIKEQMEAFSDGLYQSCPTFWEIIILIEPFIANWMTAKIPDFNALEYIRFCKLFTINRVRTLDEFGLSGIQTEIPLPGGESYLSEHLIRMTNYSMAYMTYVCQEACEKQNLTITRDGYAADPEDEDTIHIMGSALKLMKDARVWTLQKGTFYQTNMCYGPTRAIFTRQALRGQPIIIDLRRLICTPDAEAEGGYRYTYNGGDILYYAPNDQGVFEYVPGDQLTVEQRSRVGLVCEACSMVLVSGPVPEDADSVFCSQDYEEYRAAVLNSTIVDLIMYGLSTHPEVTTQIHTEGHHRGALDDDETTDLTNGYNLEAAGRHEMPVVDVGSWVLAQNRIPFPDATTPEWDLVLEKANLQSVPPKFGATTSQYKAPVQGDRSQADRNAQTMPFAPIHIYGSTYDIKIAELEEAEAYIANNHVNDNQEIGLQRVGEGQCRDRAKQHIREDVVIEDESDSSGD